MILSGQCITSQMQLHNIDHPTSHHTSDENENKISNLCQNKSLH